MIFIAIALSVYQGTEIESDVEAALMRIAQYNKDVQWKITDDLLSFLNEQDENVISKSVLYSKIMEMRPE